MMMMMIMIIKSTPMMVDLHVIKLIIVAFAFAYL